MWSRCGRCKFQSGSSKSTKRVLVSTGSRGFSFGKFLELRFSNSSLFNRLPVCGHSLHRDFLYFFGYGHLWLSLVIPKSLFIFMYADLIAKPTDSFCYLL